MGTKTFTSEEFKAWRKNLGLTQEQSAEALNRSKRAIFGYENGEMVVPPELTALCQQITQLRDQTPVIKYLTTVFKVSETTNEYGAEGSTIGYFSQETTANKTASGRGWYGGTGSVRPFRAAILDDGTALILAESTPMVLDRDYQRAQEDLRISARKKIEAMLTREEIDALDLNLGA